MQSLDQTIQVRPKLGFWTWIQPSFLHEKSNRSLYIWGAHADWTNTNRINTSSTFMCSSTFYLYFCIFLLVLRRSSRLEAANWRGPRGSHADLGQPIAAAHPDGFLSGERGFSSTKATIGLSCIPCFRWAFLDSCGRASPSVLRVYGDVFVCEQLHHKTWPLSPCQIGGSGWHQVIRPKRR
jgi:hypothetical protein